MTQSEAPSVVDWLYKLAQQIIFEYDNKYSPEYSEESYGSNFNTDAFCKRIAKESEAKINRLILEARIEELKHLKQYDSFNKAYTTDTRCATLVDIRIEELSNNLSKGDGDGN